nr:uncharacterized protein LOC109146918 [Ipomoea batatas]
MVFRNEQGGHNPGSCFVISPRGLLMRCMTVCLMDLGMVGNRFRWEGGRGTEAWVQERLNTVIATLEWLELFEDAAVCNLLTLTSDHPRLFTWCWQSSTPRPNRRTFSESQAAAPTAVEMGGAHFSKFGWRITTLHRLGPLAEYSRLESELPVTTCLGRNFWAAEIEAIGG